MAMVLVHLRLTWQWGKSSCIAEGPEDFEGFLCLTTPKWMRTRKK